MDGKPIAAIACSTKSEITKLGYLPRIAAFLTKPSQDRHRGSRAKGGLNSESFSLWLKYLKEGAKSQL